MQRLPRLYRLVSYPNVTPPMSSKGIEQEKLVVSWNCQRPINPLVRTVISGQVHMQIEVTCRSKTRIMHTDMAVTKLAWRFRNRKTLEMRLPHAHDTNVIRIKMTGMIASSEMFFAFNCDASFVKTTWR